MVTRGELKRPLKLLEGLRAGTHLLTSQGLQAREAMVGDIIKLDEPRSKGLTESFYHASYASNVVVGGTDEGEKALDGVLL